MRVIIYVGLDVHNDSIAISLAPSDSTEVHQSFELRQVHQQLITACDQQLCL